MDDIKPITAFSHSFGSDPLHYDEEMTSTERAESMKRQEIKIQMSTLKPQFKITTQNSCKGSGAKVLHKKAESNASSENNTSAEMPGQFLPKIVQGYKRLSSRDMGSCKNSYYVNEWYSRNMEKLFQLPRENDVTETSPHINGSFQWIRHRGDLKGDLLPVPIYLRNKTEFPPSQFFAHGGCYVIIYHPHIWKDSLRVEAKRYIRDWNLYNNHTNRTPDPRTSHQAQWYGGGQSRANVPSDRNYQFRRGFNEIGYFDPNLIFMDTEEEVKEGKLWHKNFSRERNKRRKEEEKEC